MGLRDIVSPGAISDILTTDDDHLTCPWNGDDPGVVGPGAHFCRTCGELVLKAGGEYYKLIGEDDNIGFRVERSEDCDGCDGVAQYPVKDGKSISFLCVSCYRKRCMFGGGTGFDPFSDNRQERGEIYYHVLWADSTVPHHIGPRARELDKAQKLRERWAEADDIIRWLVQWEHDGRIFEFMVDMDPCDKDWFLQHEDRLSEAPPIYNDVFHLTDWTIYDEELSRGLWALDPTEEAGLTY